MDKETASILNSEIKKRTGPLGLASILRISACACVNELTKSIESNIPQDIKNKILTDLREILQKWKERELKPEVLKTTLDIARENALRTLIKSVQ